MVVDLMDTLRWQKKSRVFDDESTQESSDYHCLYRPVGSKVWGSIFKSWKSLNTRRDCGERLPGERERMHVGGRAGQGRAGR